MWILHNQTPFAAERTIVVDVHGARHWVVVVKGTFDIQRNGSLTLAKNQVEPKAAPEHHGEPGESSLRYEADLIPAKLRTDVYLNATAYAPEGRPTTKVTVGVETPLGTKRLVVHGDRVWKRNLVGQIEPSPPQPFVRMPIVYERAYGGFDCQDPDPSRHRLNEENPVGTGFFTSHAHRRDQPLPNVELLDRRLEAQPAGYGALCSYWQPRLRLHGTYDTRWVETRKPLLATDYDPLALQCGPIDQQVSPFLRGGERFGLINLSAAGSLGFALPKHYFALTTFVGKRRHEHRAAINTVIIEPDHPRVIVVWHSSLACHHEIDDIDFTEIVEKPYLQRP
jgi:hypothetical protein